MLISKPTENGTGVSIYGAGDELEALHNYLHLISNNIDPDDEVHAGKHQLLMNFTYEVRKAFQESRLEQQFVTSNGLETYYGFSFVWIDILVFMNVLTQETPNFSSKNIFRHMRNVLYRLIEDALTQWDTEDAQHIIPFISSGIDINSKYIFLLYQHAHVTFVNTPKGKKRFKGIPKLIEKFFNSNSSQHKALIKLINQSLKEHDCQIQDLGPRDFPEIVW